MVDGFLSQLAKSGLLGLLLVLSLFGGFYLFKKLLDEKDKRLQDAKDYNNAVLDPLKNIQTSLSGIMIILDKIQKAGKE